MAITLVGYRGSGKSSIAPRLARRLNWTHVDSDRVIEQEAGCSIREIFEQEGEAGFRQRESRVLLELLTQPELVIASGGGAILSEANRQAMKASGPVVWLHASIGILAKRLGNDRAASKNRPSLTGKPIDEEIAEVLAVREPLYRDTATLIVNSDGESPEQVTRRILRLLEGTVTVRQEPNAT